MEKTKKIIKIPEPSLRRLPVYLQYAKDMLNQGQNYISAPHIGKDLKMDPTQVTKDITYAGISGKTRVGYEVEELINGLEEFLGFRRKNEAFLFGAGSLGAALINYPDFKNYGLKINAAFDTDPEKVGKTIGNVHILHPDKFRDLSQRLKASIGIITTPSEVAQSVADLMVAWGIKAIWNFAPVHLKVPDHVILQNTAMYTSLALILNKLKGDESDNNTIDLI